MLNLVDFKTFDDERYARHLVLKTDNMEILVVCWPPGQETVVHGHGPTDGVVIVLDGEMQNTDYHPDGKVVTATYKKGAIVHAPVGFRHKIANRSTEKCVTLHIYSPPLGKEYLNPDLGYSNETKMEEIQLPDEVVRYMMACTVQAEGADNSSYTI